MFVFAADLGRHPLYHIQETKEAERDKWGPSLKEVPNIATESKPLSSLSKWLVYLIPTDKWTSPPEHSGPKGGVKPI
jgi:hypothetical protein